MPSLNKFEKKSKTNVFHIRIGNNIDVHFFTIQKIDLNDPAFLKILQQQYATKYLQSLGVQSTSKNIYKILKEYPIENCEILQSRLNGGLYTDTITIIPKTSAMSSENQNNEKQQVSSQMIQMLDLKRMGQKKYQGHKAKNDPNQMGRQADNGQIEQSIVGGYFDSKKNNANSSNFRVKNSKANSNVFAIDKTMSGIDKSSINMLNNYDEIGFSKLKSSKPETQIEGTSEGLKFLSFNIEDIKSRYIFPFNDNFKRKANYKIQDSSNLIQPEDPKIVYEWNVFHFPFTRVKLSLATLKELQNPIDAKMSDISSFLDSFYQQFPNEIFPQAPDPPKQSSTTLIPSNFNTALNGPQININNVKTTNNGQASMKSKGANKTYESFSDKNQQTTMVFTKQQIDMMFSNIRSQSMVKMIGVFLHLAYWCIFGGVNPIQIQSTMKKKMYIMMFETIEYFKIKVQNKKLWAVLVFPMILLTLKMAAHYFFSLQYSKIFQSQDSNKQGIDELALDKIMYLVEKMFDQSNINGRFIFLQSEITGGAKGTFLKDKEFIRNRIFGTSPGLHIILPNPKNGRARAIMAKNLNKDKFGSLQNELGKTSHIRSNQESLNDGKQCQQKLLVLALHKINNRLQQIQGHSGEVNPIINIRL